MVLHVVFSSPIDPSRALHKQLHTSFRPSDFSVGFSFRFGRSAYNVFEVIGVLVDVNEEEFEVRCSVCPRGSQEFPSDFEEQFLQCGWKVRDAVHT